MTNTKNYSKYEYIHDILKEYSDYKLELLNNITQDSKNLINLELAILTLQLTSLSGILYNEITNNLINRYLLLLSIIIFMVDLIIVISSIYLSNRSKNISNYCVPFSEDSMYIFYESNINIIDMIKFNINQYYEVIKGNNEIIDIKKYYNKISSRLMIISLILFLILIIILTINLIGI